MIREPRWESEDAISTRVFLESQTGIRFMARLRWLRPGLESKNDATARLIESGKVEGYEQCVDVIETLQDESRPIKDERVAYPDLDDPKAWDDAAIAQQNSTTT